MVSGPAADALNSLSDEQVAFLRSLPKAELHAHLNGSIPLQCLQDLARESAPVLDSQDTFISKGIKLFEDGITLDAIGDFFSLFPAIYALTSTPQNLKRAAAAVLDEFLSDHSAVIELRSTPRKTPHMTRLQYMEAVLAAMDSYPSARCGLIVSIDFRMNVADATECLEAALKLKRDGKRILGIDICGDFQNADISVLLPVLKLAQGAGLPITVHIAESRLNPAEEADALLSLFPNRLGHATFLNDQQKALVLKRKTPIEICLSSNLLCKTRTLEDHHILFWLKHEHPVCICTDDALPFRTNLLAEYSLLLAQPPLGLGLSRETVAEIAAYSMTSRLDA